MVQLADLQRIAGEQAVRLQEPMSAHTTFRIGGPADYFVEPGSESVLKELLLLCRETETPFFILGNGSNLLVSDEGYRGVMISLRGFDEISFREGESTEAGKTIMTAGCGVLLSKAAMQAAERGLTGFEFAGGIPGTLGGAVTMNAGAYGGEIRDVIFSARVMTKAGDVRELSAEELDLSYRHSIIQEKDLIVLSADFAFAHGDEEQIKEQMRQLNTQRREKQPLEYGSAGSTFKRPEGYFAGKLIQDAGLKGYRSGDVMVSEKHSGFVVNVGKGTCGDAMRVIEHVQRTVYEQFGVELELEVKRV
ncbi:UDP-N-acetylmuramate dehydrogenase [Jutongia huaianensis]|uniref:UDP-N-acetylenolpyruvoylglucosamine reductase n=1 Tax=Jutongia huaianensis TaxID=2763668 RepID=A0ABR7MZ20_9FIRM|nr:UDP-N-acetylmuramate dehydrogenase [Jutongia huaianensis]MBC8561489.1 UDP-N-acetylmuramate dehydrogenase [Jutongia huaianensis]